MTSRQRLLTALDQGVPDRLPITIHQWQGYHLRTVMGGCDQLEAFRRAGLDAAVAVGPWSAEVSPHWTETTEVLERTPDLVRTRFTARTPDGELTWVRAQTPVTGFLTEHPCKTLDDARVFLSWWPRRKLDRERVNAWAERTGDDGLVRGYLGCFNQPGAWQELCELFGTQEAILLALDEPEDVHELLEAVTRHRLAAIEDALPGAHYDLIEHGGGAASCTVISPSMFAEFCLPYDTRVIAALQARGYRTTYHTCGGMRKILDLIPKNGTNASETLSPVAAGGDIHPGQEDEVKAVLGRQVALIGGIDQQHLLEHGTPDEVRVAVRRCFESYGAGGGYICSACDHFFSVPLANLQAMAEAARDCVY
jgi:hypothetical protein